MVHFSAVKGAPCASADSGNIQVRALIRLQFLFTHAHIPIKHYVAGLEFLRLPLACNPCSLLCRREVHSEWWSDAAKALGVEEDPRGEGFGVTPAILSTTGVQLVFERLQAAQQGDADFLANALSASLTDPGGW